MVTIEASARVSRPPQRNANGENDGRLADEREEHRVDSGDAGAAIDAHCIDELVAFLRWRASLQLRLKSLAKSNTRLTKQS